MARIAFILGLFITLALASAGCGGGRQPVANSGPMPENGTYTGIWNSPQYGEMQLVQTGQQVVGCYVMNERRGRIQGSVEGNVMRFEWSERREMVVGRPTLTRGRGYFVYQLDANNDHVFTGEWGADDNDRGGGPWNAWRDRRRTRRPNPECSEGASEERQQGDSFGSESGGDSFDSNGSSGSSDDGLGGI